MPTKMSCADCHQQVQTLYKFLRLLKLLVTSKADTSILEAGLDCMEQLVKANADWKFFFNAIGTALPGRPIRVHLLMLFPSI